MIIAILFAWFGYKKANESGRNGILWAIIAAGVFIGTQLLVSLLAGFLIGVILLSQGNSPDEIDRSFDNSMYNLPITVVAIIASIITGMIVLHFAGKPIEEKVDTLPPPPPTSFGQNG